MPRDREDSRRSRSRSPRRDSRRIERVRHSRSRSRSPRNRHRDPGEERHSHRERERRSGRSRSRSKSPAAKKRRYSESPSRSRSRSRDRNRRKKERADSVSSVSSSNSERRKRKKRKEEKKERKRDKKERKEKVCRSYNPQRVDLTSRFRKRELAHNPVNGENTESSPRLSKYILCVVDSYLLLNVYSSIFSKTSEFQTWLVEERKINPETISKDQSKKEFARFIEDYNTGEHLTSTFGLF